MDIFWQRLDAWFRIAMPSATAVLLALLGVVVWPLPYLGPVMPPLAFIALFYWSAHRPDLFPSGVAFLLGVLNDVINGFPLGVSAFLFTLAHQLIWRQRRFFAGHSFFMLWSGFALASALMMVAEWLLIGLVRWQATPFLPVLVQTVLAIVVFPLPCWIMIWLQRSVLSAG
ncbi:MAG: rod shape-determining protein MreD [Alphaproteobacteria bacterium]|nr:rod shape-determining protein MreD [Alphaproteobacteria bacterium]